MEDHSNHSLSADDLMYEMRKCSSVRLPIYQAQLRSLLMRQKKSKAASARRRSQRVNVETKSNEGEVDMEAGSSRRLRSLSRSNKEEGPEDKCGCKKRRKRSCARKKKRSCRPRKRSCRRRSRRRRSCRRRRSACRRKRRCRK